MSGTQFPSFFAGLRLTATLLGATVPIMAVKGSATARTSTTTLADDPDLSGIALAVGTYEIEFVGNWTQLTTNTQKIKTRWGFTGTWNGSAAPRSCIGAGSAQTGGTTAVTDMTLQAVSLSGNDVVYDQAAGTSYGCFRETCGNVVVSSAGNFSIQWAQNASSANATNLQEGSYVRIIQIA